jgi:hypothetical protein
MGLHELLYTHTKSQWKGSTVIKTITVDELSNLFLTMFASTCPSLLPVHSYCERSIAIGEFVLPFNQTNRSILFAIEHRPLVQEGD